MGPEQAAREVSSVVSEGNAHWQSGTVTLETVLGRRRHDDRHAGDPFRLPLRGHRGLMADTLVIHFVYPSEVTEFLVTDTSVIHFVYPSEVVECPRPTHG